MRKALLLTLLVSIACLQVLKAQPYYYSPDVQNFAAANGCNGCHGGSSGFFITTYAGILQGGNDCGDAVVPFDADASPLVWQIDPSVTNCPGKPDMPLGGPAVSPADIALIREWINTGALENAASACADLVISAYVEGSSFNKCVEIYNGTGTDVDLSGYSLDIYNNGNATPNESIPLSGILTNGDYYLVCHTEFTLAGLAPDQTSTQLLYNGNDAIAINNGSANVDVLGQIGVDPGDAWVNGDCSTENATLVKIDNGTGCRYGVFSGNSDFSPVLGGFYACFAADDVTALNTYEPGCPTIPNPVVADVNVCQEAPITPFVAEVATPDLNVNWFDESGNLLATGLEFTAPEPGNYAAQAFDANGCNSEKIPVAVNTLPLPFIESISYNCSPDGTTFDVVLICGGTGPFLVETVSGIGSISQTDFNAFLLSSIPSGDLGYAINLTDGSGCSTSFFDAFTCPTIVECPQLTAVGDTALLFCPATAEGAVLKVNVVNANETDVQWSTGETGISITLPNLVADNCDGTVFTYTATIPAGIDCPEVSVTFTLNVLPDPSLNVQLLYDEANCVVSVEGACPQFMTETSVNGGPNLPGVAYNLAPGETADVLFTIYDPTDLCATLPYIIGGTYACIQDFAFSGGAVWNDANFDGLFDETTETGIAGVAAYLIDAGTGDTIAADVSNVFGYFYFEFIPTGSYYIQIDPATLPADALVMGGINELGQSETFTLGSGESFSLAIPLQLVIFNPCLTQPIIINTQEINSCSDGTYVVRLLVTGGDESVNYFVLINDTASLSLPAGEVAELGPFTLGTNYNIAVTDVQGCTANTAGFSICAVPVTYLAFTGSVTEEGNLLRWVTAAEVNNHYFTLLRSSNGVNYTQIAQINGAGTSSTTHTYTFTDTKVSNGIYYYRLQQTDYNGNISPWGVVSLERNADNSWVAVSPVPAQQTVYVQYHAPEAGTVAVLQLFDTSGKLIRTEEAEANWMGKNTYPLDIASLPNGLYYLTVQMPGSLQTVKLVKN
ncbi:T9SS C-terminal target domain-containing protein [Sphingobacteriales bacterium UPWRP_1]|nr:hypothetical protein BVG80_12350 [Sphingobacteriales bacterium TSM_CSM]PSJ73535.1 T9SS C-terminal target domain-containing protein [Sphingobacteriales bacterium UPWRP_1]